MTKSLSISVSFLFCCMSAFPQEYISNRRASFKTTPVSSCDATALDRLGDQSSTIWFANDVKIYGACAFSNEVNEASICAVSIGLRKGDAGSAKYYVSIWSDNAGSPGTRIGTESGENSWADLPSTFTTNKYALSTSVSANQWYWVVVRSTSTTSSTYGYLQLVGTGNPSPYSPKYSSDGSSWTDNGPPWRVSVKLWK